MPSVNKARTFYVSSKNNTGVRVDSEVNVVFIQTNDNRTTTEFGTGIDYLDDVIADLHEASGSTPTSPVYDYEIAMLIENARATTVIVRDTVDTYKRPVVVTTTMSPPPMTASTPSPSPLTMAAPPTTLRSPTPSRPS